MSGPDWHGDRGDLDRDGGDDGDGYDPIVDGFDSASPPPPAPPEGEEGGPGPEGCPVVPIGTHMGRCYFVTRLGELTYLRHREMTDLGLLGLFGGDDSWLWRMFPRMVTDAQGNERQVGWNAKRAAAWLMREAEAAGLVDVAAELRGLGTWAAPDPEGGPPRLVVHAGDRVLVDGKWKLPGRHGPHLYGADRRMDRPGKTPLTPAQAGKLLDLLRLWNIRGPRRVTHRLLLGFIAAATMPGALDWRPSVWLVGAKETGKTTLQALIADLLGSAGVSISNTSEAAIRHVLGVHALSVLVDEFETSNLGPVVEGVLDLVRVASSGRSGKVVRGGMDGKPVFTTLVASFAFSSIHAPHLSAADRSRLTVFEFGPLASTGEAVAAFEQARGAVAGFGPALRRRCIDHWQRFPRTLATFAEALAGMGHGNRARDQLGTLLAWAQILLSDDDVMADEADALVQDLDAAAMAEEADDLEDHEQWLLHLLASRCGEWTSGERRPIGRLIADCLHGGGEDRSKDELAALGLAVEFNSKKLDYGPWLLVANTSPELAKVFAGTRWEKVRWRDVLLRVPSAKVAGQVRFHSGLSAKAVAVHVDDLPLGGPVLQAGGGQ